MRSDVLERKIARIVVLLAKELNVTEEQALDIFYSTETYHQLTNPEYGLYLMSDGYIIEDVLQALDRAQVRDS